MTKKRRSEARPQLSWPRRAADGTPLGVDLATPRAAGKPKAYEEVKSLVLAALQKRPAKVDPLDVVQSVAITILRRNKLPSAYDPRKCSFGHYVWLVTQNVVSHMLELESYQRATPSGSADELPETQDPQDATEAMDVVGDETVRDAAFASLCERIARETSVLVRAERVREAQEAYGKLRNGRPKKGTTVVPFLASICRATGLSRQAIIYDLQVSTIAPDVKRRILGRPLANRTRLLVALSRLSATQQRELVKFSSELNKFVRALAVYCPRPAPAAKAPGELTVALSFGEPSEIRVGARVFRVVLGRDMTLHLLPAKAADAQKAA